MEIEYNEDTIAGYDWLNICSINHLLDLRYLIVFNDLRGVIWNANIGDILAIVVD